MSKINQLDDDQKHEIDYRKEYSKIYDQITNHGLAFKPLNPNELVIGHIYTGHNGASDLPRSMACDHTFKRYTGFTDAFEYCTLCDTKKRV